MKTINPKRAPPKATPVTREFQCDECPKSFNKLWYLRYHERQVHEKGTVTPPIKHKCPLCDGMFLKGEILTHINEQHGVDLHESDLRFDSFLEFKQWKELTEKETKARFKLEKGVKRTKQHRSYSFVCHRSGTFFTKSRGMRQLKSQGSNKIGAYCPAGMKVKRLDTGECEVVFKETHVGHDMDPRRLTLPKTEQNLLEYTCTCAEFGINWNTCKHIRLVARMNQKPKIDSSVSGDGNLLIAEVTSSEAEIIINEPETNRTEPEIIRTEAEFIVNEPTKNNMSQSDTTTNNVTLQSRKESLLQRFKDLMDSVSTSEECDFIERLIMSGEPTLLAMREKNS